MTYRWLPPPRFRYAATRFGSSGAAIRILDIGCGNHSPTITRYFWPNCRYDGVDINEYNLDDEDQRNMNQFFRVTPEGDGYEAIPDATYDFAVMNHVIEHMNQPQKILRIVCSKLKPGGLLWLAFPSERSLGLPSAEGTLQFCDDPTHIYFPNLADIVNWLLAAEMRILRAGRTRDALRSLIGIPIWLRERVRHGLGLPMRSRGLWFLTGFETSIAAEKRSPALEP